MTALSYTKHHRRIGLFCALFALYQLWTAWKVGLLLSSSHGNKSLFDDLFRSQRLWPGILFSMSICATLALAVSLVLGVNNAGYRGFFGSVGDCSRSVRCPTGGYVVLVDNRTRTGAAVLVVSAFQSMLVFMWCRTAASSKNESKEKQDVFPASLLTMSLTSLVYMVVFFVEYLRSNRFLYRGPFPWIISTLVFTQALVCLSELYFSFFTQQHIAEPIFGALASSRSNYLVAATLTSAIIAIICLTIQKRPYFVRPGSVDDPNAEPASKYADLQQNVSKRTPLASPQDIDQSELVDTSEHSISWFGQLMFSWTSSILAIGRNKQLDYSDICRLDDIDTPESINERFQRHHKPGRSLLISLLFTFTPELLAETLSGSLTRILEFSGPFFLQRILHKIQTKDAGSDDSKYTGMRSLYLDVCCLWVFGVLVRLLSFRSMWIGRQIGMRMRVLLVTLVTAKTLKQRGKGYSAEKGDPDYTDNKAKSKISSAFNGKIMSILSTDIENVMEVSTYIDPIYVLPIQVSFGIWYLYQLLGVSALLGLVVSILYMPFSKKIYSGINSIEKKIRESGDKRIAAMTELVQGIKAVKLFGWESKFLYQVNTYRAEQLKHVWNRTRLWTYVEAVIQLVPVVQLVLTFGLYVLVFKKPLTAEIAFPSISVLYLVRSGMVTVSWLINRAISGHVSLVRIEEYLNGNQVQDIQQRVQLDNTGSDNVTGLGFDKAHLTWDTKQTAETTYRSDISDEQTPILSSLQSDTNYGGNRNCNNDGDCDLSFALVDISIQFPIGSLSLVAGPTGSGKSSLLSALIGEMTLLDGRIQLPTAKLPMQSPGMLEGMASNKLKIADIAYVAQEAWLRNATIRDNILFGEPYSQKRYEETLHMCALKPDLRILSAGDMTEIGERGVTLSGGQKQRVALARAIYSNRHILLINDCLSAVDAHTAQHIITECLAGNSPLMQERTIVLVTHHVPLCLPYAQHFVLLKEGRVVLQGAPRQIHDSSIFQDMFREPADANKQTDQDGAEIKPKSGTLAFDKRTEDSYNQEHLCKLASMRGLDPSMDLSTLQGILVKVEEREEGRVKFKTWLLYIKECGNVYFWTITFALISIWQLMVVMQDYWIRLWVNTVDILDQQHSASFWLGIYMVICMFSILLWIAKMLYALSGGLCASKGIHAKLAEMIVHAKPRFFDSTPIGRIINRFSRDMQVVGSTSLLSIITWCSDVVSALGIFVIVCSTMPSFIFMVIIAVYVYAKIAYYYLCSSRELNRLQSNSMSPLLSLYGEIIQGVSSIRAFGAEDLFLREALNRINMYNQVFYLLWGSIRWMGSQVSIVSTSVTLASALFILHHIDIMDAGIVGFVLSQVITLSIRVEWIIRNYGVNEQNMNSVERITQYLEIDQEAALHSKPGNKPPANWPSTGNMQIENLVIEYMPGAPVLNDISASIKHGEKIGIVGRTGAGKSTLALALLRFVEAASGRILLDGVDISKIGLEELRRNVTIIPQDPVLFNGTIRFNIDPFSEYPDELVWDALKRVHLVNNNRGNSQGTSTRNGALDIDNNKDAGQMTGIFTSLDAEIKENGQNLSLGQRQLVALARALVRRSRLVIMDEATASVDFDTDNRIQRTIRGQEFSNSTLLCIAHRLRTIIDYDRVLVLDKGRVVEFDTLPNLLQKQNGVFKGMCESSGEYDYLLQVAHGLN